MTIAPVARQLVEVAEAGEAELAGAVHGRVIGERRVEAARLSRVGADRLDADAEHVALVREHRRRARVEPRGVRAVGVRVDERGRIGPPAPSRPQQHPGARGDPAVRALPRLDPLDRQQKIRIPVHLARHVDDAGGADEAARRDRVARVVGEILPRHPVHGRVEMRAGVLAEAQRVPVPRRARARRSARSPRSSRRATARRSAAVR